MKLGPKPEYFSTEYLEACDREDARQIESAADTIIHELADILPEEIYDELSAAWSKASSYLADSYKFEA